MQDNASKEDRKERHEVRVLEIRDTDLCLSIARVASGLSILNAKRLIYSWSWLNGSPEEMLGALLEEGAFWKGANDRSSLEEMWIDASGHNLVKMLCVQHSATLRFVECTTFSMEDAEDLKKSLESLRRVCCVNIVVALGHRVARDEQIACIGLIDGVRGVFVGVPYKVKVLCEHCDRNRVRLVVDAIAW